MHNKNLLIIFIVFLVTLVYINNSNAVIGEDYCTSINICPGITPNGDYSLNCNRVSDSFCPENYSTTSWISDCPSGSYSKCVPCDPDCGTCGDLDLFVKPVAQACSSITNTVVAYPGQSRTVTFYRGDGSKGYNSIIGLPQTCGKSAQCTFTSQDNLKDYEVWDKGSSACFGGDKYCYSVCSNPPGLINCPFNCGYTKPNITITPNQGSISGSFDIKSKIQSNSGLKSLIVSVEKWDPNYGENGAYRPVDIKSPPGPGSSYCSFRLKCGSSNSVECSYMINKVYGVDAINYPTSAQEIYSWDTTQCENAVFNLTGTVEDTNTDNTLSVLITTNNANPPCTDECPIFTSKTLNTLLARVKTWITPPSK